jgi:hypothetical protein
VVQTVVQGDERDETGNGRSGADKRGPTGHSTVPATSIQRHPDPDADDQRAAEAEPGKPRGTLRPLPRTGMGCERTENDRAEDDDGRGGRRSQQEQPRVDLDASVRVDFGGETDREPSRSNRCCHTGHREGHGGADEMGPNRRVHKLPARHAEGAQRGLVCPDRSSGASDRLTEENDAGDHDDEREQEQHRSLDICCCCHPAARHVEVENRCTSGQEGVCIGAQLPDVLCPVLQLDDRVLGHHRLVTVDCDEPTGQVGASGEHGAERRADDADDLDVQRGAACRLAGLLIGTHRGERHDVANTEPDLGRCVVGDDGFVRRQRIEHPAFDHDRTVDIEEPRAVHRDEQNRFLDAHQVPEQQPPPRNPLDLGARGDGLPIGMGIQRRRLGHEHDRIAGVGRVTQPRQCRTTATGTIECCDGESSCQPDQNAQPEQRDEAAAHVSAAPHGDRRARTHRAIMGQRPKRRNGDTAAARSGVSHTSPHRTTPFRVRPD